MSSEVTASAVEATPVQDEAPKAQPAQLNPSEEKVEKKEPPKEELNYSSKFAALSRREKQILERERKFKEQEQMHKEQLSKVQSWESKKSEFKKNPDLLFQELGISFDDIVNLKLGIEPVAKESDPNEKYTKLEKEMREELQKLKEERELEKKAKEQQAEAENAQILETFKNEIISKVSSQPDKYELINYQKDFDLVYDLIEEYYNLHGEVMEVDAAAEHVEKYLEDLVQGVTKLKKFSTKLAPKSESPQPEQEAPKKEAAKDQKPKTLSNSLNSSSSSFKSPVTDIEESKKRAASLLRWT